MVPATATSPLIAASLPPGMGMRYTEEILDRKTGELVAVDKGDWITLGELAQLLDIGRRQLTTVLREMNFLQIEGTGESARHRIRDWVMEAGWGRRNRRKSDQMPFDVISPEAVRWIAQRWQDAHAAVEDRRDVRPVAEARQALEDFQVSRDRHDLTTQGQFAWLADHFPNLTHQQIADALHVSRQLIDRFMKARRLRLSKLKRQRDLFREPSAAVVE